MSQQEPEDRPAGNPDQLNGWKEIATYLGKAPRTVQRWERAWRLPVRRIQAASGEVVFASRKEIDAWKLSDAATKSESDAPDLEQATATVDHAPDALVAVESTPHRRLLRLPILVGLGVVVVVLLSLAYALLMFRPAPVLSSDSPHTRPQGQTYQFWGRGFTPAGAVTRWMRVPNGNQEVMSSLLLAGADGNVRWSLTTDCGTETGTHLFWLVDERTQRRTEPVSAVVLRNPECDKPSADLVPRDVAVDRTSVRLGEEIIVTFSLWNIGTAPAVPTTTRIRLGVQSTRTGPGDSSLGDHPTPAIPIGESRVQQVKAVIPSDSAPGVYYVWLVADNGGAIIERNNHNNFARSEALAVLPR